MPQGNALAGGRELALLKQQNPIVGQLLDRVIESVNRLATNATVSPTAASLPAPEPVNSTQVKGSYNPTTNILTAPGEILHFVHMHNTTITRGIQYVTEVSANDPNFSSPHAIDTGASRSGFTHLPAKDDDGNPVVYYLRVTPQHQGSLPAKPTVFGTAQAPTGIVMTGSTQMSLLPSQAAGTARPGQGGQGLGVVQQRPPLGK